MSRSANEVPFSKTSKPLLNGGQNLAGCEISMKRFLTIVLGLTMAALLAGCGTVGHKPMEFDRNTSDPNILMSADRIQRGYLSD